MKFNSFRRKNLFKKADAFTMIEVLVVMVIVGILILVAMPIVEPLIAKAKSTEAKTQLAHIHTLEKSYYYEYSKYSNDLKSIGFEHEKVVGEDGGRANYRIEIIEAGLSGFLCRATAAVDFDGDGTLNVWEIDEKKNLKEVVPD